MARDRLSSLIHSGSAARVSTSMELKDSDFGTGFGAHVTVSLACQQEESTVEEAAEVSMDLAGEFVKDAFDIARAAFERKIGSKKKGRGK